MRALIVTTAGQRATLAKLLARLNARDGYPKDGVNVGGGDHAPAAQSRTLGYAARTHPTKANERAFVFTRPQLRAVFLWAKERIAERIAAGTDDADDRAIDALTETDLPAGWTQADPMTPV